jgi:hypothetical protein
MDAESFIQINAIRIVIGTISVLGLYIWIRLIIKYRDKWLIALGPLTYFFHVLAFNLAAAFACLAPSFLNMWSQAVRIHSMFLLLALGAFLMERYRHKMPPV